MTKKANTSMKPRGLRGILVMILVLFILIGGVIFYFGYTFLRDYAVQVYRSVDESEAHNQFLTSQQPGGSQAPQDNELASKAKQLTIDSADYQTTVRGDLEAYAKATDITIANIKFVDTDTARSTRTVSFTLDQPVSYKQLIHFLTNVENNLPKFRVSTLELGPGKDTNTIKTGTITLIISVR